MKYTNITNKYTGKPDYVNDLKPATSDEDGLMSSRDKQDLSHLVAPNPFKNGSFQNTYKLGVVTDCVRGWVAANNHDVAGSLYTAVGGLDHNYFGDPWNASLARIDYAFEKLADMGMHHAREFAMAREWRGRWHDWGVSGSGPLVVTDQDGWEAVDRVVQLAAKHHIVLTLQMPNLLWNRYHVPLLSGELPNYNTYAKFTNNFIKPIAEFVANRYKDYTDVLIIDGLGEINLQLMGRLIDGADQAVGDYPDPRWMDVQATVYDAFKAASPNYFVQLQEANNLGGTPNSLDSMIDQLVTRDIGYGAGWRNSGHTKKFIDIFDDMVSTNLYLQYTAGGNRPNANPLLSYYGQTGTVNNLSYFSSIKAKLASYGRPNIKFEISEFGDLWPLVSPMVTFTNGLPIVTNSSGISFITKFPADGTVYQVRRLGESAVYTVASVDSDSQITLTTNYTGITSSADATLYNYTYETVFGPDALTWLYDWCMDNPDIHHLNMWRFWDSDRANPGPEMLTYADVWAGQGQGLVTEDTKNENKWAERARQLTNRLGYSATHQRIGINTPADPSARLQLADTYSTVSGTHLLGAFTSYGDAARYVLRRANGTATSPTAVASQDNIGSVGWRPYASDGFAPTNLVGIAGIAAESHTPSAKGTYVIFQTTLRGTTSARNVAAIDDAGNLGVGVLLMPTEKLDVDGNIKVRGSSGIQFSDGSWQAKAVVGPFDTVSNCSVARQVLVTDNGKLLNFTVGGIYAYLGTHVGTSGSLAVYNSAGSAITIDPGFAATGTTLDGSGSVVTIASGQGVILSKTGSLTWATIGKTSVTSAVTSVFGRTGAVVKASGDYAKADITGLTNSDAVTFGVATLQSDTSNPLIVSRAGGGASITLQTSSGTLASPTAVTSGMGIGNIQVLGATGAGTWDGSPRNSYRVEAEELWTASTGAYGLAFHSRATGALGLSTEKMRISGTGLQTFKNGGGIPHGHMYSNTSTTITVSAMGTWYEVDTGATDFTAGLLLNVTQTDHYLTVATAGRYKVDWHMDIASTVAGDEIAGTVMVNGVATETAHGHATVSPGATAVATCGMTILQLAASDQVSLAVENHSAARNITMKHAQLVLTYIGN